MVVALARSRAATMRALETAPVDGHQSLVVRGLGHHIDGLPIVAGVDLAVAAGEVHALVGPSGCGKSTTLRLIAGLEPVRSGTVEICGRTVAGPGLFVPPERRRVELMFQDYALFPHLTVAANVAFGLGRLPRAERAPVVDR